MRNEFLAAGLRHADALADSRRLIRDFCERRVQNLGGGMGFES